MAQINDKNVFSGILNTDDGLRSLPQGDYPDSINNRVHVTEQSNDGSVENTRGNVLIQHTLPAGTNKTIGTYEDKNRQRIVYFNWNSAGNHGIYQFFWNRGANGEIETILVSSVLNFNVNKKITGINIVEALTGDLLYWTDDQNRPRKINIDKANETNKKRKFELFFGKIINPSVFDYTTTIFDQNGVPLITWQTAIGNNSSLEQTIVQYLSQIPSGALALATFSTCYQFLTVEMKNVGGYTMSLASPIPANVNPSYAVAKNFYPDPFLEEFIDAIKYPTICEPAVSIKQDATRKINLIQNKIFQFRIKLVYDDNEKSVLSPYSRIPDLPISCGSNSTQTSFNYVEVNFNSQRLFDLGSLAIIKRVELYVREHNTGKVKYITALDKWQFLQNNNTFNFYNDGIYQAIDDATALKNYDALPLLSKSQEFGTNRIEYGGITEGYDPVCVDAKLNLSYEANVSNKVFSFSGKIYIRNFFAATSYLRRGQPIRFDASNQFKGYVFGGMATQGAIPGRVLENVMADEYHQNIPLGGFVMYLAGTSYYAISKQPTFPVSINSNINQDTKGVLNAEKPNQRAAIRDIMQTTDGCYSEFTISNVPAGKYILRCASHLTTDGDLNDTSLKWQKTSTAMKSVAGQGNIGETGSAPQNVIYSTGAYEAIIEIDSNGGIKVNGVLQPGTTIPDTEIMDLSNPQIVTASRAIVGYLTDDDIPFPVPQNNSVAEWLQDTRIELARVEIYQSNNPDIRSYTDHNGFFWGARWNSSLSNEAWVGFAWVGKNNFVQNLFPIPGNINTKDMFSGSTVIKHDAKGVFYGVYRFTADLNNLRTKITGILTSGGNPVTGVNVLSTKGGQDQTDPLGAFDVVVYADTTLAYASDIRIGDLLLSIPDTCVIEWTSISYTAAFSATPNGTTTFNYTTVKTVVIPIISVSGDGASVGLKRNGQYSFGLVYYDNAIRDNNVNTSEQLQLKIPFYTDELSAGNIVGQGKPIVEMEIDNLPPSWATHYQIVRTLNGNQGKYLQWTAKTVTYVDDNGAIVSPATATQVKIDMEGVLCFLSANPDSKISYAFEEGDRLVLIKTDTGNFYNQYLDFKIKGFKTGASLILYIENLVGAGTITAGTLFEIYNPLKKTDINIYYEIGECFEIGNPGTPTAFHAGTSQNQVVSGGVSTQPAKVTLTTGDTWYRARTIPYSTGIINSACNQKKPWFIEDASISDFFVSNDQSIGRIQIYNKDLGERYRPTAIRFSNVLVEETKLNGLNSFEGLNEKVLPLEYGLIQKLIMAKDILCSVHNNSEFVSMYMGKDVLLDNALQGLVAVSNKVIQQSYQYQGGLGTQNPESVCIDEENIVYGYDNSKGMVWSRVVNGLIPISEIKMRTYFRNKSEEINANGGTFVYGWYDNRFKQYGMSFEGNGIAPRIQPISGTLAGQTFQRLTALTSDTIAFNTSKKGWESRYTFYPEFFGGARNNVLVSFRDGEVWRHNSNTYNNFYGVQYTRRMKVAARQFPSDTKVFLYLSTESSHAWGTTPNGITTLEGQVSELSKTDMENIENVFRADLLKDLNTPNIANPLIEGDDLRSSILQLNMEDTETVYSTIYAVNLYSIISNPTNK